MAQIEPLGDRAVRVAFATEVEAYRWAEAARDADLPGVVDVVLAYRTVAVLADPDRVVDWSAWVQSLGAIQPQGVHTASPPGRLVRVPVWYGGIDLNEVAEALDLSAAEVVARHSATDYQVFAVGFQPGFPYAGYLPQALSGLPRRCDPRARVPAGSVAIAGRQTGIYPQASPGGWHLLGTTPYRVADLAAGLVPIAPGDTLRFEPITRAEFERIQAEAVPPLLCAEPNWSPRGIAYETGSDRVKRG